MNVYLWTLEQWVEIFRIIIKATTKYELILREIIKNKNYRHWWVRTVFGVMFNTWDLAEGNIGICYILLFRGWLAPSPSDSWLYNPWSNAHQKICYCCPSDLKDMYRWTHNSWLLRQIYEVTPSPLTKAKF